jgi:glycosyltransferase involved in cell wall biosynthesis
MAVPVSVVISTFDQPNALAFALLGYQRQTYREFELVVADDGSDEVTRAVIEEFRTSGSFPIKHVWQENTGFRKAKIINQGVLASEGGLLVFSDGDCIPHRDFVRVHAERVGPGMFATGGSVVMPADYCRTLTREQVRQGDYERCLDDVHRREFRKTQWRNAFGRLFGKIDRPKILGRNVAVSRDAFTAINGYDENYDGFGKEDSDLRNRLRRSGARPLSLWTSAWVFHVDDSADPVRRVKRIPRTTNLDYYQRPDIPIRAINGMLKDR